METEPGLLFCGLMLPHVSVYFSRVRFSVRCNTMRPERNGLDDYFQMTGNLPSFTGTGTLIALLCTPGFCLQNSMWVFSCGCFYPVLLLKRSIGSSSDCSVYGYHTSYPCVRIGSTKLSIS